MKKKLLASVFMAALSLGAANAQAAIQACEAPLTSAIGNRWCQQTFEDLAAGLYQVSFEFQAEKLAGNLDKSLLTGWVFDSAGGTETRGVLQDSTSTPGWMSYSFVTQAQGDATLLFSLRDSPRTDFGMSLQNIQVAAVPEPGTYAMFLGGLAALGFMARRRRM